MTGKLILLPDNWEALQTSNNSLSRRQTHARHLRVFRDNCFISPNIFLHFFKIRKLFQVHPLLFIISFFLQGRYNKSLMAFLFVCSFYKSSPSSFTRSFLFLIALTGNNVSFKIHNNIVYSRKKDDERKKIREAWKREHDVKWKCA